MKIEITQQLVFKSIELILVIVFISLLFHNNMETDFAAATSIVYLIILAVILLAEILNKPINIKVNFILTVIGGALFLAVGIPFVQHRAESVGYVAIVAGIIMLVDGIVVILQEMKLFK